MEQPRQPPEQADAILTPFEKYETRQIHRRLIKKAPYNPRSISAKNRARLQKNIKQIGLLQPPIINKSTWTLVGGHQRLGILDSLMGTDNYLITVCVVDLTEKQEREQNIFLNNPESQGEFIPDQLAAMYKDYELDYDATGFDKQFLQSWLGESLFGDNPDELREIADRYRKLNESHQESIQKLEARDDPFFLVRVVFKSSDDRARVMAMAGADGEEFVNGDWFERLVGGASPKFPFICDNSECRVENWVPKEASAHKCDSCGNLFEIDWTPPPPEAAEAIVDDSPELVAAAEQLLNDDRFAPPAE